MQFTRLLKSIVIVVIVLTLLPVSVAFADPPINDSGVPSGAPVVGTPANGVSPLEVGSAWETMAPLPSARVFHAAVADGNYIYVIGGTSDAEGSTATNTNFRYNTQTNAWDTMTAAPAAVQSIDGACINGKIYIPGDVTTADTYVYDIASDNWSTIAANGGYTARQHYAAVALGNNLLVLGGIVASSSTGTNAVWAMDTTTNTWSEWAPMQTPRINCAAAVIDNQIYVAGGVTFPGFIPNMTAEKFDGASWSHIASLPNGSDAYDRWSYMADGASSDGRLWLAAGRRDADWAVLNHAGFYDPDTDSWTDSPTIPTLAQGRVYLDGAVANEYFYVMGGRDSAGSEIYDNNERLQVADEPTPTTVPTAVPTATATPAPTVTPGPPAPPEVPEPGTMMLLASGLAGLGGLTAFRARFRR